MQPSQNLSRAWHDTLRPHRVVEADAEAAYRDLVSRYDEPGRAYHNRTHLGQVLDTLRALRPDPGDGAVELAAWFHDAVYDPRARDNEAQSADLAARVLSALGLPESLITRVRELILLTQHHRVPPGDRDGAALLDADLAILGTDPAAYEAYARAIRQEYAWVEEGAYRAGRARILEGFLNRERVYSSEEMYRTHEAQARANLRAECTSLRSAPK